MKKKILIVLPLFYCLLFQSCKKDSTEATTNTGTQSTSVVATMSSGSWAITSFTQRAETKTSDFSGIDFTFTSDGKVAVTGTKSADGTWSYSPAVVGYYGDPSTLATFTINIVSGSAFSKLSKKWNVVATSATSLNLTNPEASEDEHITFTKK